MSCYQLQKFERAKNSWRTKDRLSETLTYSFVSHGGRVLKSYITNIVLKAVLIAVTGVVATTAGQANAQEEAKAGLVAILDVAKVFKENQGFDSQMKGIKAEADQLKAKITQEQETIKQRAQQVTQYDLGSPERNKLEAQLEQEQAALRTKARQAEADLLNREARVYYETYQKMQSVVGSVASSNGCLLYTSPSPRDRG